MHPSVAHTIVRFHTVSFLLSRSRYRLYGVYLVVASIVTGDSPREAKLSTGRDTLDCHTRCVLLSVANNGRVYRYLILYFYFVLTTEETCPLYFQVGGPDIGVGVVQGLEVVARTILRQSISYDFASEPVKHYTA